VPSVKRAHVAPKELTTIGRRFGSRRSKVATIPAWLDMVVNMDELDINPPGGPKFKPQPWKTRRDLLEHFEASLKKGREVLQKTTDDRLLNTKWRMLPAGKLMSEATLRGDSRRRAEPHGPPPWTTHRVSTAQRRKGARDLRPIRG
jgi:hypothetical protein